MKAGLAASILTVVTDHPPDARKQLGALFSQTAAPGCFEVIVVDSVERGDFVEALREFRRQFPSGPRIDYQVLHGCGRARANNAAMAKAEGEVLI